MVGPCWDSPGQFVLGWVLEAAGTVASRFEGAYLSVARGNWLLFSDLSGLVWSQLVSLLSWFLV